MSILEIFALAAFGIVFLAVMTASLNVSFRAGRRWWDILPIFGLSLLAGGLAAIAVISITKLLEL